jgi:hypothetical protein
MIPMTSSATASKASTNSSKMMVNMVSPAEQTVQMAEKQLKKTLKNSLKERDVLRKHTTQNDVERLGRVKR